MKKIIVYLFCIALVLSSVPTVAASRMHPAIRIDDLRDLPVEEEVAPVQALCTWSACTFVAMVIASVVAYNYKKEIQNIAEQAVNKVYKRLQERKAKHCPCITRQAWCFCGEDGNCECIQKFGTCTCVMKNGKCCK